MEPIISDLLTRFEKGSLSRRELVQGLAMLAATGTAAAAQEEIDFKERGASKMAGDRTVDWDNVKPTEIEHKCEEIFHGEALEQKYNYIVYHFDSSSTVRFTK
jgi:hypothetical protein